MFLIGVGAAIGSILGNAADKLFQLSHHIWEPAALAAGFGAILALLLILQFNRLHENGGIG